MPMTRLVATGTPLQIFLDESESESAGARGSIVSDARVEFGQWLFKIERGRERKRREMRNDATCRLSMHDIRSVFNGRNVSFKAIDSIMERARCVHCSDNCNHSCPTNPSTGG